MNESKIAGVCSGMGDYFEKDPVVFRLLLLLSFFVARLQPISYFLYMTQQSFRILQPKTVPFTVPLKLKNPHNLLDYKGLTFIVAVWMGLN